MSTRALPGDHDQPADVSADEFVGRDRELDLIRRFVARAVLDGEALVVRGDAGTGKTALLSAAAAYASDRNVRVLRASGAEFEADLAFAGLHQALDPLYRELPALDRAHQLALRVALGFDEGPIQDQLIVANAALTLLRQAAPDGILLVVDDIHWLDRASAKIFGFVARRVGGSRLALLGATRSGEESFFDRAGLPELELLPLDDDASRLLLDTRFPSLTSSSRRRVLDEAEGNPLALLELPAALERSGVLGIGGAPAVLPLSRRLQGLFASRIADLPPTTRRQLLFAALDRTGSVRILRADEDHDDLVAAEASGLLWVDPDTSRLAFRHPLIRTAVVELSTNAERREAHRRLARLLADQPDRRAWHLGAATDEPDESVAQLLEQAAGRILRRGDAVGAIAAFTRASELSPSGRDCARRLSEAAYVAADVAGEIRDLPRLLDAARAADPNVGGSLETAVATHFALINGDGDVDTAHRLLVGAVKGHPTADASLEEALRILIRVCYFGGREDLWAPVYDTLDRFGARLPADLRLSSQTLSDPARTAKAVLSELDAAIAQLPGEADPLRIYQISAAALHVDQLEGCREALWRVVADGRRGGAVASAMGALLVLARDDLLTGRWDEADRLAEELIELSRVHDYRIRIWHGHNIQAMIAAGRGQFDRAHALSDEILRWATPRRVRSLQCCAWQAKALAAAGSGDFESALYQANSISPAGVLASHVPHALWVIFDLVEAAVRTGRVAEAAAHVQAARDADLPALSPRLALVTFGAAALAATDADGIPLFELALGTPGIDRWPFDLARVQLAFGERLRRVQAVRESRLHLAAALAAFEQMGAVPWADRARAELRSTGQSKPRGDQRDPDLLTPKEREIALLAAAGLSNKQIGERLFLSHRTVGFHLHRVFPKLGVTSRAALRDALAPLPPPAEPGSNA